MPKVVSNTTPIISLLKIGKLDILKSLYSEIIIPYAVFEEIEAGKHTSFYKNLVEIEWFKIKEIQNRTFLQNFNYLDPGEAEAIVLASELKAELLLIDERAGRYSAIRSGLKITGTLGILIEARQNGLVKNIRPLLYKLRNSGVWFSEKVMNNALGIVDEIDQ